MIKVLRVAISEEEWKELKPLLTHHGHLSHIVRQAVRSFILANQKKGVGDGDQTSQRRGVTKA